ncbi:hypothetical protein [Flavobacterium sp.]|uniref:OB-fold protein n=1 Tax=Flavobacterium sp. TaxID=239 RepID=UPI0008AB5664|nr:hypothetical protein [Flavobacterium sp.]OGS62270.1 MAG: hypothetical protein A2X07_00035 [Flavobacteria bacterium GWF1_32_7]HBD26841.1 hypothetical protein [Flavobacterium sp.]
MNRKLKFRLGLGVALVMISAIVVLYFYVYQSHRDIDAEQATFETSVSELSQRFLNNPDSSTVTYADQTISIYGNVTALDLKQNTITLDNKLIATTSKEEINRAKTGELVKLKGRFIGYDELFNELRMDQCTIEE